jgi:hypothetical protein
MRVREIGFYYLVPRANQRVWVIGHWGGQFWKSVWQHGPSPGRGTLPLSADGSVLNAQVTPSDQWITIEAGWHAIVRIE